MAVGEQRWEGAASRSTEAVGRVEPWRLHRFGRQMGGMGDIFHVAPQICGARLSEPRWPSVGTDREVVRRNGGMVTKMSRSALVVVRWRCDTQAPRS